MTLVALAAMKLGRTVALLCQGCQSRPHRRPAVPPDRTHSIAGKMTFGIDARLFSLVLTSTGKVNRCRCCLTRTAV